jgi:hypothetical protein
MPVPISITTPSLLFPTISLLLLAYTSRSLALTSLIRDLHDRYRSEADPKFKAQIERLKRQVKLIRNMQAFAVLGGLLCVLSMFLIYFGSQTVARWFFAASMILIALSFSISLMETALMGSALMLQLDDMGPGKRDSK